MSKMGQRFRTIRDNYRMAREHDPRLGWILAGIFVLGMAAFVALSLVVNNFTWMVVGFPVVLLAVVAVFSRRAMRSAYRSLEGKPGAAVAVVQNMARQGWGVTGGVAVNRSGDMVHRAVGRPGVVLIGEGTSPGLGALMAGERKRTARFVAEIPINEILIGEGADRVAIAALDKRLRTMNKVLSPGEVTALRKRLEALGSAPLPVPKGPMPKNARVPRGGKLR